MQGLRLNILGSDFIRLQFNPFCCFFFGGDSNGFRKKGTGIKGFLKHMLGIAHCYSLHSFKRIGYPIRFLKIEGNKIPPVAVFFKIYGYNLSWFCDAGFKRGITKGTNLFFLNGSQEQGKPLITCGSVGCFEANKCVGLLSVGPCNRYPGSNLINRTSKFFEIGHFLKLL